MAGGETGGSDERTSAKTYRIPESLDKSSLDIQVAIRGKSGAGTRPVSLRVLIAILGSFFLVTVALTQTFLADAPVWLKLAWIVLYAGLSIMLIRTDKTGEMRMAMLPAMIEYLPRSARQVICRRSAPAGPIYSVVGIDSIDVDRDMIRFSDGTVGYAFLVVGSGSILLFDEDRDRILARVDAFWRKVQPSCQYIFVTTKEAQRTARQVAALDERRERLLASGGDADLVSVIDMQRRYLSDYVGRDFRSIHQYLIFKAENIESLTFAKQILEDEAERSSCMFKRVSALFDDDLLSVFAMIFQGKETV